LSLNKDVMRTTWRTLIIDDEPLARERLKRLLNDFGHKFEITGFASNGEEAQEMIERLKPDIIFLDIQMPGKSVFKVLSEIQHKPFVVFCTAYDQYSLQAFDSLSLDYLIKPIEEAHLKRVVEKIDKITEHLSESSLKSVLDAIEKIESKKSPTSIPHKVGDKTILVKLDKVVFLEAEDKYVNFYNAEGIKYLSDQSLKSLEEKLPEDFIRVSRSAILNKNYVIEVNRYFRGRMVFVMDDIKRTKIISGTAYSENIKKRFDL
jgi:two-component system, LytTR family, response regulator